MNTTGNGLGERTGNAALEEVVMALKRIYGINSHIHPKQLLALSALVANASNCTLSPWKAGMGENVFGHESGIHVHGVLKDPQTYEAFSPAEIGWKRQLVVGKHSGRHLIRNIIQ